MASWEVRMPQKHVFLQAPASRGPQGWFPVVVLAGSLPGWKAGMQIQIPFGVSQPPQVPASRSVPGRVNGPGEGESLLACSGSLTVGLGAGVRWDKGLPLVCPPLPAP